jgi:RNA polymerase primary sigma factor
MHAIEKFDPEGARLPDYAAWWVQHATERAILNHARAIRLPVYTAQLAARIGATQQQLFCRLGREATVPEIAGTLDAQPKRVAAIARAAEQTLSLQTGCSSRAAKELVDLGLLPEELLLHRERARILLECCKELDQPDRKILLDIYGIAGRAPKTVAELSRAYNLTPNAIRRRHRAILETLGRAPQLIKLVSEDSPPHEARRSR